MAAALTGMPEPSTAQASPGAPLRFGLAYTTGKPQGRLASLVAAPTGFSAWLSLPFSRTSWLGLRGEFSVLTVPEESVIVGIPQQSTEITVTLRSTIGFTGAGPRIEIPAGPVVFAGSIMGGLTRVISDLTGRAEVGEQLFAVGISESDNAIAAKATVDLYLPLLKGPRDAALGLSAGFDWTTSRQLGYPEQGSFRIDEGGDLVVNRSEVPISMLVWRVGVGVVF
jgi:hypothetical protein